MEPDDLNKPVTREAELDRVTREFREWQVRHKATLAALDRVSPSHDDYSDWASGQLQLCDFDHDTQISLMLTLLHEELVGYCGSDRHPVPIWEVEWRGTRLVYRLVVNHPHEVVVYVGSSRGRSLAAAIIAIAKEMDAPSDAQMLAKVHEVASLLRQGHWRTEPLPKPKALPSETGPNKWDF